MLVVDPCTRSASFPNSISSRNVARLRHPDSGHTGAFSANLPARGLKVSLLWCILVGSRKAPPVGFRRRAGRGRDHAACSHSRQGRYPRASNQGQVAVGGGPEWEEPVRLFFAFSCSGGGSDHGIATEARPGKFTGTGINRPPTFLPPPAGIRKGPDKFTGGKLSIPCLQVASRGLSNG